jgi:hypothetical protein
MRITEHPYTWFLDSDFPRKMKVQDLARCSVWMTEPLALTLVLLDPVHRQVAVFEYDNLAERDQDIRTILNLRDDRGRPDAGIGARIWPRPPRRSGSAAQPLPEEDEE